MLVYAVLMILATFIEKQLNTAAAKQLIYYSPFFILLQFLMVLNFILILIDKRFIQRQKWSFVLIHLALVIILTGALITHIFGKEGTIHIREGEKSDIIKIHTLKGIFEEKLPFTLELTEFRVLRYPGSMSPSSYESDLRIHINDEIRESKIFMNNVLNLKGYRFFQASYDEDELGTILSVNKDVAGRTVTYSGYFTLIIGFLLMFISPNSRLRKLGLQLKTLRCSMNLTVIFFLISICSNAQNLNNDFIFKAVQQNAIPPEHAQKFAELSVQLRGRVVPMNTFSSEILRKLHRKNKIAKLDPDQFLLSLLTMPQMWMQIPFISISNSQLARMYDLSENYFAYNQAFDSKGNYKLLPGLKEAYHKLPAERTVLDKDIIKLDEQINTIFLITHHRMPAIFPDANDHNQKWYAPGDDLSNFTKEDSLFVAPLLSLYISEISKSLKSGNWQQADAILASIADYQKRADAGQNINPKKNKAEIRYNRQNIFAKSRIGYFIFGGLLLVLAFVDLFNNKKWIKTISGIIVVGIIFVFLYHIYGIGMRWYISGYAPWSNSYETMVYTAWATVLAGFVFGRKSFITLALATLFGAVILFVSGLNWMDPQITPLVPVLKSPWLMFHVAIIVAAYGFFGISFLLALSSLIIMSLSRNGKQILSRIKELSIINNMSLLTGLALMTVGTFLGAVWANESWGRYWGWDPKETWALITVVVYTIVTHLHLVKKWNGLWLFNLTSTIAFTSVLMTFFGVNYFLSGMHSYAQNDQTSGFFHYFYVALFIMVILAFFSYQGYKKNCQDGLQAVF